MLPLISDALQAKIAALRQKHPGVPLDTLIVLAEMNDSHAMIQSALNQIALGFLTFEAHLVQIQAQFEEMLSYATTIPNTPPKKRSATQQKRPTPRQRLQNGMGRRQGVA